MNSLELINEKIKMVQVGIDSAIKIIKEFDGIAPVDSYKKLVEEHLKEIQMLEQIKTELEAWEVVKEELQIEYKGKNPYGQPLQRYELNVIGKNKIDTLEKALDFQLNSEFVVEPNPTGLLSTYVDEKFNEVEDEKSN